jgi:Lrp/AsnC family transcriptional regulator, leucine-responsive regulatory protein
MINHLDAEILNLVQRNNRLTVEQIGKEVGLSPSACQRRLHRLREEKVILGDFAMVDPAKVGKKLTMIIDVTVDREKPDIMTKFKDAMRKHPQVMQCYYVTGDKDFILIVSVRDMEEFEAFQNEFCTENPAISRFSTSVVVDPVKIGFALTVEAENL